MYIQIAFTNAVYTQVTVKSHGPFCVMKYQLGTNKNTNRSFDYSILNEKM